MMESAELNKKYAHCYVKVKDTVYQISEFSQLGDSMYVYLQDEKGKTTDYVLDDINLTFNILEPALYNYKNNVVLIKKTGERQWKRGFGKSCYQVEHPLMHLFDVCKNKVRCSLPLSRFSWAVSEVSKIFKPYSTYQKAFIELSRDNNLARAFDKGWFISLSMDSDGVWLFFRKAKVATITDGKVFITNKDFLEEVLDLNIKHCIGEVVC